ncbi:MAG TPA: ABC transporter substrate-binding protein, partial [Chloroflexota bacterium]|nr:ABC transporter substrate-binding protein [Chloroflexota bacterium]
PAAAGTPVAKPAAIAKVTGNVNVLATWGGDEQANFLAMVKPFEDQTGAKVQYEGTRDLNAVLTTRVSGGNPPDVAGLPGPGQMAQFGRQGKLIDLTSVLDANQMRQWYADDWTKLAQVDGKQVGIFIKAALKGLIWYNTKAFQQAGHQAPKTWDDLMALSQKIAGTGTTPWSIGLESGAASGWPGTDWIEDIVLRQAGTEAYDGWAQGKVKWSSDGIKKAWTSWGQIVNDPKMTFGGKAAVLSTNFGDAANPLFQNPPKAFLHHQANFMTTFITKNFSSLKPGQDFDVFPFPDIDPKNAGAVESAGDLFGMFKDTPQARELMKWLVTPDAQAIWVQKGGALSPNKAVPESAYPDSIAKRAGEALTTAKIVRFDASDLMPEAMNNAFWKGILDFVNGPNNLDQILASLDKTQADAYKM